MFDIRNYNKEKQPDINGKGETVFWTQTFLSKIDSFFPKINTECEQLLNNITPRTEDAFTKKVDTWHDFVKALQKLCVLYKIPDAQCLSRKN